MIFVDQKHVIHPALDLFGLTIRLSFQESCILTPVILILVQSSTPPADHSKQGLGGRMG